MERQVMMKVVNKISSVMFLLVTIATAYFYIPPPQPARSQFVDQSTYGGTSGGTGNAPTITIANYSNHTQGVVLRFMPGAANTASASININGLGPVIILRPSSIGNVALSGDELRVGELTCVTYNGAAYQLSCNVDMTPIGRTVEYRGSSLPRGTLIEDGSCVSRTTFAPLFSVIGTTYGACDGSTTFGVPDSRGSMFAALDNQGANGSANRITSGGSGCSATSVVFCGLQNVTLNTPNLPPYTPAGGVSISQINVLGLNVSGGGTAVLVPPATGGSLYINSATFSGTPQTGTSTPASVLNPVLLGRRAIKY